MILFDAAGSMAGNTFPGLFSDITRIDQVRKALAQVLPGSLRQSAINPNQRASRRGHGYASSAIPTTAPVSLLRGRFFRDSQCSVYPLLSFFSDTDEREGGAMSADAAKTTQTEPPIPLASPYGLAMPTGYRVAVVPGALEISARLVNPEEIRNLMKVLRAGIAILEDTTDGDMDKPLTLSNRVAAVGGAPRK